MKGYGVNPKTISVRAYVVNIKFPLKYSVLVVHHIPSSKSYLTQTVRAKAVKICPRLVHILNNLNMKGHAVTRKTVGVRNYSVNFQFLSGKWNFCCTI